MQPSEPVPLRYAVVGAVGAQMLHCSIVGTSTDLVAPAQGLTYPMTMALYADRAGVAFSYFDLVAP
jgi:hypothetical protein